MNKYKNFSQKAQLERQRWQMCERKKAFATSIEANQPGQHIYQCPFCQYWHRSGSLATFVARIKRKKSNSQVYRDRREQNE